MADSKLFRRWFLIGSLGGVVALIAGFGWLARRSDSIPFLPAHRGASWIVFPAPANPAIIPAVPAEGRFRRAIEFASRPTVAEVKLSAFHGARLFINGAEIRNVSPDGASWKTVRTASVEQFFRAGTNLIEVTVTNNFGPPALWLLLKTGDGALPTEATWEVSLAGATWRPAQLAAQPPSIRPGNLLYPEPGSDVATFPTGVFLFAVAAMVAMAALIFFAGAKLQSLLARFVSTERLRILLVGGFVVGWVMLFWNNLPQLNRLYGYDAEGHEQYVRFIQQNHSLPLATDGWQMYQPPLYYATAALALNAVGWTIDQDPAVLLLRAAAGGIGLIHVALLFLSLRLVFPASRGLVIVGTLLGALLPAHLCLSHFVTNESLAALFVTASLYFCLRTLRESGNSIKLPLATGLALGAALLTKFSAVLVVPLVVGALAWPLIDRRDFALRSWLRHVGVMLTGAVLVCGWHYARVWLRFGSPLVGNWDAASQFAWWQFPGYRTASYFTGFGQAILHPLYAGIGSFGDGLYSTLWSDGLASSASRMAFRPPWNYELMFTANALGLVGVALVVVGLVTSVRRLCRRPTVEVFLFAGLLSVFVCGIVYMVLRVASYAQVKAFYGLPALLPFCVMALTGWDAVARRHRMWQGLLGGWFCVWVVTVFAAFWVRADNPQTQVAWGIWFNDGSRFEEAMHSYDRARAADPQNTAAAEGLADLLVRQGRGSEARRLAEAVIASHPNHGAAFLQLALALRANGETNQAMTNLMRAIELAPELLAARQQLALWHWQSGRFAEAVQSGREAVALSPYESTAHALLGLAWGGVGDLTNALSQLQFAVALKPEWPMVHQKLGALLEALHRPGEALVHFHKAATQAPQDVEARLAFALALERHGQLRNALAEYEQARQLQPDRPEILNNFAWLRATANEADLRNGDEAVRLAAHACAVTGEREPLLLGTLAAAYAEAGRFPEAIATAERARDLALKLGLEVVAKRNGELLQRYRAGQPVRDPPASGVIDRK